MSDQPGILIGELIRQRRKERGMTLDALAEAADSHRSSICEVERGTRALGSNLRKRIETILGPIAVLDKPSEGSQNRQVTARGVYIGSSLREAMQKKGIGSQKELAAMVGLHYTTINTFLRNTKRAGEKTLARLEAKLGKLQEDSDGGNRFASKQEKAAKESKSGLESTNCTFAIRKTAATKNTRRATRIVDLTPDPDEGVLKLTKQDLRILMDLAWQLSNRNH